MSSESDLSNSSATSPKQRPNSKSQKASLTRIAKAQVTLLISNLDTNNFTQKSSEIHTLIETHGEDIREHLFRYLLSDIHRQDLKYDTLQFDLLKENAKFSTSKNDKTQAMLSFALALEQFAKSDAAANADLVELFEQLKLDYFDRIFFSIPLFSGTVKSNISEKAKIIFTNNIQNAILLFPNIKSVPDDVLKFLLNSIAQTLIENSYEYDFESLQILITLTTEHCTVIRILDMIKEPDVLLSILDAFPPFLALDLASLAAYQKIINLETWLKEKVTEQKDSFVAHCLGYLSLKISVEVKRQDGVVNDKLPIPLSLEAMSVFLKVLAESPLSSQNAETIKEAQNLCLQTFPKLMNVKPQSAPGSTGAEISFESDVEDEANTYYERIYSGELSIEGMIELLKKLSASQESRDQDVFACMIHNLFDEYLFFPKYPDKELSITGVLFGSLIQHRLVSFVPLGITLRYVLDALRNPLGSKMFNFGIQALRQFQSRLGEWPQYCSHLLQISELTQSQPELVAYIQDSVNQNPRIIQADENLDLGSKSQNTPFTAVHVPSVPQSSNVVYSNPSETAKDTILFIINNVAQNNIDNKVADLKKVLKPSQFKWFSNYLVVKRVSSEPNYHELYDLVLNSVNSTLLDAHILCETFANILILLNSEKTVSKSSERTLLKNLGSWLGRMTVAKNKPILQKYVAFKDLLFEGYDTQRLIVTIPFVCKVLEQTAKSKVFKPPNPWLMAILRLMVELYEFADLKLNLKFEIEVLCKTLSLELKDVTPTNVLKNRQPQAYSSKNAFATGGNPLMQNSETDASQSGMTEVQIPIPSLAPYISFNPQIALFSTQPAAKRLVLQALTESVRDIIGPVVERAVAIAVVSTRDLVIKDFVMESDANKMRKAAHVMAQNLAASLAMVTSKEPLRLSIITNLRTIFLAHGLNDSIAEQAIMLTVAENLDLMCAVIEKASMEKATTEIDEALSAAFVGRKKHHEQRPNQRYVDMETYQSSDFPNTLPPLLRPKPGGLQPNQLSMYEDFMRIPRVAPTNTGMMDTSRNGGRVDPTANYGAYGSNSPDMAAGFNGAQQHPHPQSQPQSQPQTSTHMILERLSQYVNEIEKLTSQANVSSISALPQNSDIRSLIRQIPMPSLSNLDKDEVAKTFAQKVVQLLYKSENQLTIEVCVVLLEHLCTISPTVGTLVTSWLTHADDERKYNVPVTVALIKAGFINLLEQDRELSILIGNGRSSAVEFTARLISACLFGENPLATRNEFMSSLEALSKLRGNQLSESVLLLMDDMRKTHAQQHALIPTKEGPQDSNDAALREQLQFYFAEWVRLHQHPATTEKTMLAFATQLSRQNIFKVDDASLFYRVCIEVSIEHAIKFKMLPGQSPSLPYQPIDALSKLIVSLVQVPAEKQADQLNYFTRTLSVSVLIISQYHEIRGQHFDQRPFLRLFSSLLSDLHAVEEKIQTLYLPLLTSFSNTLYTLQPMQFSGFTFAWLQLVSHRFFMSQLLLAENQKGWPTFQRLLVCLFQFLVPYLRNAELRDTTRMLYRGTLRVLLVLLHDFPEFLCDYHYSFCDIIPLTCIQLRNLILSAFPRNMRLPDPFTQNLKIDLLPDINQSPRTLSDFTAIIEENGLKEEIDHYMETQKNPSPSFLKDLVNKLKYDGTSKVNSNSEPLDKVYNVALVNAVTFYIGTVTISKGMPVHQGPAMEIYQYLLSELDSEGRYIFLSAIANQLRYPNSHTHYFSCVLLYLFAEGKKEIVKEKITRVLLERLIVNRPHPWGLLITFIELIKNPRYSFWSHSFTRCAADIERLFESISRSINQN